MMPLSLNIELRRERITWVDCDFGGVSGRDSEEFKLPYRITISMMEFDRIFRVSYQEPNYMAAFDEITRWLTHNDLWMEYGETASLYEVNKVMTFGGGLGPLGREEVRPKREWTLAFENENAALAFKLAWF